MQCHHWPSRRASCNFCTSWHSFLMRIPCCVLHCQAHFDAFWTAFGRAISTWAQGTARVVFSDTWPEGYYCVVLATRGCFEGARILVFALLITPSREDVCQCMCFLDPEAKATFMNRKRKTEECFLCRTVRQRSWIAFSMKPDALEVCQQLHGC